MSNLRPSTLFYSIGLFIVLIFFLICLLERTEKRVGDDLRKHLILDLRYNDPLFSDRLIGHIRLDPLIDEINKTRGGFKITNRKNSVSISVPGNNEKLFRQIFFNFRSKQKWEEKDEYIRSIMLTEKDVVGINLKIIHQGKENIVEIPWEVLYSLLKYNSN